MYIHLHLKFVLVTENIWKWKDIYLIAHTIFSQIYPTEEHHIRFNGNVFCYFQYSLCNLLPNLKQFQFIQLSIFHNSIGVLISSFLVASSLPESVKITEGSFVFFWTSTFLVLILGCDYRNPICNWCYLFSYAAVNHIRCSTLSKYGDEILGCIYVDLRSYRSGTCEGCSLGVMFGFCKLDMNHM